MVKAGNEPGGNMSRYVRHGSLGKTTDCRCYWTGCSKTEPTNIEWRQPAGWVRVGKPWRERLIAEGLMTKRGRLFARNTACNVYGFLQRSIAHGRPTRRKAYSHPVAATEPIAGAGGESWAGHAKTKIVICFT